MIIDDENVCTLNATLVCCARHLMPWGNLDLDETSTKKIINEILLSLIDID
jgi:hypothetical protein